MKITVKNLQQQSFEVDVPEEENIGCLKALICSKKDCNINELTLIFNGSVLKDDEKIIKDININEKDFVVILIKKPKSEKVTSPESIKKEQVKVDPIPTPTPPISSGIPHVEPFNMFEPPATSNNSGVPAVEPFNMFEPQESNESGNMINGFPANPQQFFDMLLQDPEIQQFAQQNPQQFQQIINNP